MSIIVTKEISIKLTSDKAQPLSASKKPKSEGRLTLVKELLKPLTKLMTPSLSENLTSTIT